MPKDFDEKSILEETLIDINSFFESYYDYLGLLEEPKKALKILNQIETERKLSK